MTTDHPTAEIQRIREVVADRDELFWADKLGISDSAMARLSDEGVLERLAPGIYVPAIVPVGTLSAAAAWTVRFPASVACALTTAVHHDLTTAWERGTWLAVQTGTTLPRSQVFPVNAVQVAARWLAPDDDVENGIETLVIHGQSIRFSGPDRTVVDLWRLTRRVSYEHAVEALRMRRATPGFSVSAFARLAQRMRVWGRVGPVLEGMML